MRTVARSSPELWALSPEFSASGDPSRAGLGIGLRQGAIEVLLRALAAGGEPAAQSGKAPAGAPPPPSPLLGPIRERIRGALESVSADASALSAAVPSLAVLGGMMDARLAGAAAAESLVGAPDCPGLLDGPLVSDLLAAAERLLAAASPPAPDDVGKDGTKGAEAPGEQPAAGEAGAEPAAAEREAAPLRAAVLRTRLVKCLWELSADSRFAERMAAHPCMRALLDTAGRLSAAPADLSVEQLAGYSMALCSAIRNGPATAAPAPAAPAAPAAAASGAGTVFAETLGAAGRTHSDTVTFDTFDEMFASAPSNSEVNVTALTVWCGQYVNGLQVFGTARGADGSVRQVQSRAHWGGHHHPAPRTLTLAPGERIERVGLRLSTWVDSMTLHLSSGRVERFGESNGGSPHSLAPPEGARVVGFLGGTGGHLHNLGLRYLPAETLDGESEGEGDAEARRAGAGSPPASPSAAASRAEGRAALEALAGPLAAGAELILRDDFSRFPAAPAGTPRAVFEPWAVEGAAAAHGAGPARDERPHFARLLSPAPETVLRVRPEPGASPWPFAAAAAAASSAGAPPPEAPQLRISLLEELPPLFLVGYQMRVTSQVAPLFKVVVPGIAQYRWGVEGPEWQGENANDPSDVGTPALSRIGPDGVWHPVLHVRSAAGGPVVTYEDGREVARAPAPLQQTRPVSPPPNTPVVTPPPEPVLMRSSPPARRPPPSSPLPSRPPTWRSKSAPS